MQVETINKIHGFWSNDDVLFINNNTCLQETSWRKANVRVKQSVKQRFGETLTNNETRN